MHTTALLLLLLAPVQEEEKPYQPKHKIDFKLGLHEKDGVWQFVVEGTTDLPDDTKLKVRVFALEEVDDFRGGKRVDEEGLSSKMDRIYQEFDLKGGKFKEVAFECRRRPYSLPYRARIYYRNEWQHEALAREIGEQDFDLHADMRKGAEADLDKELKETLRELSKEMDEIQKLFRELKSNYLDQQKHFVEKTWTAWSRDWLQRVSAVADRNEDRWLLWVVWLERQGRFRIEGFCDRFHRMLDESTTALKGDKDAFENLQRSFENFLVYHDEAREVMGIDAPFDPEAVGTTLAPYGEVVARIREIAEKSDGASWAKEGEALRTRARTALLALGSLKLVPRRGYERVLALSELFLRVHELADRVLSGKATQDEPGELRRLLRDHEAKLREFREYAGLK